MNGHDGSQGGCGRVSCEVNHTVQRMKRGLDYLYVDDSGTATLSHSDVDAALQTACSMGRNVARVRMPWESTSLMRQVLGKDSMPWLQCVKIQRSLPAVAASSAPKPMTMVEKKIAIR